MNFLSILTEGRGHIYRDPLRSQQGPRLLRLRRSLLLRRPQSGICGKDKSTFMYKRKQRNLYNGKIYIREKREQDVMALTEKAFARPSLP